MKRSHPPVQMEPMNMDYDDGEVYEGSETSTKVEKVQANFTVENATIDVEVYAAMYPGPIKVDRLVFVADHCPALKADALRLAIQYLKDATYNTGLYANLYVRLSECIRSGTDGGLHQQALNGLDNVWIDSRTKKANLTLEKLDNDLKNNKSNSIKESIRRGHDELGEHYLMMGDLTNALKCFSRSRDYCTSGKHILNMCLNVIRMSVMLHNWHHVFTYVFKAENTAEYKLGSVNGTKVSCAAGLAELAKKEYKKAANLLLRANFDHFTHDYEPEFLSPHNVATYAGLMALATFDRTELHRKVISSVSFKLFLELEPQLREAIAQFYQSQYAGCLSTLDEMKDNLLLDIYLSPHVTQLLHMIRQKALVQYFSPYSKADLNLMATAFNTNVTKLQNELMALILEGEIKGRIDSHNGVLIARQVDLRRATFEKTIELGKQMNRRTKCLILRQAILRNGQLSIKASTPARDECILNSSSQV